MNFNGLISNSSINFAHQAAKRALNAEVGVSAVVLATADGFPIASAVTDAVDPARIAALASSIASIGSVATQETGLGRCSSLVLNTERGFAIVHQLVLEGHDLVLIMVADGSGLLAQVMYQVNQFVKELATA